MPPERILIAIDEMEIGGSQRQIANLLAGLDRTRWQPELLYFRNESFLLDIIRSHDVLVHRLPKRSRVDPRFFIALTRLLRERRYALVHAYSLTAELWLRIARLFMRDPPPMIASIRGLYENQSALFWRLKRFILRGSAAIISNSQAGVDVAAHRCGMSPSAFDVVGNGFATPPALPEAKRTATRIEIGVPAGRLCAIFVGRLVEAKNISCLLDALAMVPASMRPVLAIVGEGPLRPSLRQRTSELQLDGDVVWLGHRADAVSLMQSADFLVLASISESSSNVLLEAMTVGCPVVASAIGGNIEAVEHERTGQLFPSDDRAALRDALIRMSTDHALRESLSIAARAKVARENSIEALAANTQRVYERCLRPRSAGQRPAASSGAWRDSGGEAKIRLHEDRFSAVCPPAADATVQEPAKIWTSPAELQPGQPKPDKLPRSTSRNHG